MRVVLASWTLLVLGGLALNASADELAPASAPVMLTAPSQPQTFLGFLLTGWDVEPEYLMWYLRRDGVPGLLTTGSPGSNGIPGRIDTRTLYGDERLETRHNDRFFGTRVRLAKWLDDERTIGLEGRAVFLERDSTYRTITSEDGSLLLARPFIDARTGLPSSEVFAGPTAPGGPRSGAFNCYSPRRVVHRGGQRPVQPGAQPVLLARRNRGARFLQLRDRLDLTAASASLPDGTEVFGLEDHYRIRDAFYGGQVGLKSEVSAGPWFAQFRGTTALGANLQQVRASGRRIDQTPEERVEIPIGLAVQPSNSGTTDRTALDWMFDVGVNVGYKFGRHVRIFAGYTLLYWDNPIRSGGQVDLVINPVPGTLPARPTVPFHTEALWGQGVNAGLELTW